VSYIIVLELRTSHLSKNKKNIQAPLTGQGKPRWTELGVQYGMGWSEGHNETFA